MTKHELIKLLDSTFHDVEFDIFEDIEGLLRVNFVIDEEEDDEWDSNSINNMCRPDSR